MHGRWRSVRYANFDWLASDGPEAREALTTTVPLQDAVTCSLSAIPLHLLAYSLRLDESVKCVQKSYAGIRRRESLSAPCQLSTGTDSRTDEVSL